MAFIIKRQYASEQAGTFTPTMAFATPGTSSWAYSEQDGIYTRIGGLVWININLAATPTIGTGSGNVLIGAIPFAADADRQGLIAGNTNNAWTWPAGFTQFTARTNGSTITLGYMGSAVTAQSATAAEMTTGASHTLRVTGTYRV